MAKKLTVTEQRQGSLDKAEELMAEALGILEDLHGEMDAIRENLEEKFSSTERYQTLEEIVNELDAAKSELESAQGSLPSEMSYT